MTDPVLRRIEPRDHAAVLRLNDSNVELLSPLTEERLLQLLPVLHRADVLDVDGEVAGFVFTFGPGTDYDSLNYLAFAERYGEAFYYLDRIVIDDAFRRRGLGSFVYDAVERDAAAYSRLALEVNTVPPNEGSMAFHLARGFVEVGTLGDDTKAVALMVKEMS